MARSVDTRVRVERRDLLSPILVNGTSADTGVTLMDSLLERARDAVERGSWGEACELFEQLDDSQLEPTDLEAMADAAWWVCKLDEAIAVRSRAYADHLAAGNERSAGYAAWRLSCDYGIKGESSAGSGWLRRAQRHLAGHDACVERGFLAITESELARTAGNLELARARADVAVELGERCNSLDLHAMGIQTLGRALIASGEMRDGMALLDEAMTLVISQRLSAMFTGWIYCNVVATCMECADVGRAGEWTVAAMMWCTSVSELTPYHGICRMHTVEIDVMHGDWRRAESEALRTAQEMQGMEQHVVADALYAIGEINLRRGDLAAAEEWFMRAQEKGGDPQPGLASVRLAQGKLHAAAAGLRLSLSSAVEPTLRRARLLATQVDVSIAANDRATARQAAEALEDIASRTSSTLLDAMVTTALAALLLAEGEAESASQNAHQAWSMWQQLKSPYDAARSRMLIGLAAKHAGDADRAYSQLEGARAAFERLGAEADARVAAAHLSKANDLPRGLSMRELEVLRLVASGRTNREIATEMVISEHTVSRHLQNIFRKLDVASRAAATAFAFENSLV